MPSESILQQTLVSMIRTFYPEFVLNLSLNGIALPVDAKTKALIIKQCKKEGMENGIQDISIYIPKGKVLNFELKVGRNKQSEDQLGIEFKLHHLEHNYYVIRDVYQAFDIIAEHTELCYREAAFASLELPSSKGKLTKQFLHYAKGTELTAVHAAIKSIYHI